MAGTGDQRRSVSGPWRAGTLGGVSAAPDPQDLAERLVALGMTAEEAEAAIAEDRVLLTLLNHLLAGPRRYDRAEAAARAGVDEGVVAAVDDVLGMPDHDAYGEREVAQLAPLRDLLAVLPAEEVIAYLRADAPALAALARGSLGVADRVLMAGVADGDDPVDTAVALAEVARPLLEASAELIGAAYRRKVLHLLSDDIIAAAHRSEQETVDLVVGFVDVVGYTSLTAQIDPTGLDDVLSRFEQRCQDAVAGTRHVQLVKFLGDAAMFVSLDAAAVVGVLVDLAAADDDLGAPVRGGASRGRTLLRGGDFFGDPVNEAARLTDRARPGSVLVSEGLIGALDGAYALKRVPPMRLHGLGVRRPAVVRPA